MHGIHNLKKLLACAKRNQLGTLQHHQAMWSMCDICTNGAHTNLHIEPTENFQCHNQLYGEFFASDCGSNHTDCSFFRL
ncbi:hypothetical protein C0J52_24860 [Blattella germanica]|nr:hypothetical protein C0J52_24860 [Blattella germanica]